MKPAVKALRIPAVLAIGFGLPWFVSAAGAADAEPPLALKRAWTITPRLTVQENLTDNVTLTTAKSRDLVSEITPGIRVVGQTARVKLMLDYSLRNLVYQRSNWNNQVQHNLNALGSLEAIEKFLFVDINGTIGQQAISAFGAQPTTGYQINNNITETSTFRLSPYIKGKLPGAADYEARYSRTETRSDSSLVASTRLDEYSATLRARAGQSGLGWALEANRRRYTFGGEGRDTDGSRWRGLAYLPVDPQLRLSLSLGRERNDYASLDARSYTTKGYGLEWMPGPRTQVSAFREQRFFGYGHNLSISHRMARSALRYTDSRDVGAMTAETVNVNLGTLFDLLYAQLAEEIPDEGRRTDYLIKYMQQHGLPLSATMVASYLAPQVATMRRQEFTYALQGVRNSLTASLSRSRNERLGPGGSNDFASFEEIVQHGWRLSVTHLLSPKTSVVVSGGGTRSTGIADHGAEARQTSYAIGVNTALGIHTNAVATLRRTQFDNGTAPYNENALVGAVSVQF